MPDSTRTKEAREAWRKWTESEEYPNGDWPELLGNAEELAHAYIHLLEAENRDLQQWVDDTQSGMWINCVYCGHRYGPDDDLGGQTMREALEAHIATCPKHPLSKALAALAARERENAEKDLALAIAQNCINKLQSSLGEYETWRREAFDRAKQAESALTAERERADKWEWVARQASEFCIECKTDEEARKHGVWNDDGTQSPYYWVWDVDEMLARYDAAHPSPGTEESVLCPDCGEDMSGPELAVHRCGETP